MLEKGQPKIIAYLKPSCGWSRGVRAVLQKYNLQYEDRDIIGDPENFAEMVQKSGQTLQPTLDIGGRIVSDVSGEEVEEWLIREGLVRASDSPADAPTNAPCSDAEHASMGGWSDTIQVGGP
ncbi:MAG TPA: glutaredoxin [Verrucomicrobiae bacterium]|mgnify:CR=1 FL=1|nr:glutaredoxin [Verrucomicrobiae bacterium]